MTGIVIFALFAVFLGLRLYAVLGKRTGHEQPLTRPVDEIARAAQPIALNPDAKEAAAPVLFELREPGAEAGLRAISAADRRFDTADFLEGAKSAYGMILEAYWSGKIEEMAPYMSDEVRAAFEEAIADRTTKGHVLDNRLARIERAVVSNAAYIKGVAEITVRFEADIAAVTRDKKGKVVAGSLTDAVTTHDSWTFNRDVRVGDPNWILTDTDEAA